MVEVQRRLNCGDEKLKESEDDVVGCIGERKLSWADELMGEKCRNEKNKEKHTKVFRNGKTI